MGENWFFPHLSWSICRTFIYLHNLLEFISEINSDVLTPPIRVMFHTHFINDSLYWDNKHKQQTTKIMFIFTILYLAIFVLMIASMWKIYEKLGLPGWAAIVPIYNMISLGQRFNWDILKIIFLFVPVLNIVFGILLWKEVTDKFGKSTGFLVGMILLPIIFFPMLAFKEDVVQD